MATAKFLIFFLLLSSFSLANEPWALTRRDFLKKSTGALSGIIVSPLSGKSHSGGMDLYHLSQLIEGILGDLGFSNASEQAQILSEEQWSLMQNKLLNVDEWASNTQIELPFKVSLSEDVSVEFHPKWSLQLGGYIDGEREVTSIQLGSGFQETSQLRLPFQVSGPNHRIVRILLKLLSQRVRVFFPVEDEECQKSLGVDDSADSGESSLPKATT